MTDPHRTSRRLWLTLILAVLAAIFALTFVGCTDVIGINDPDLATECVVWVDGADLTARGGVVVREATTADQRRRCRPLIVMRIESPK